MLFAISLSILGCVSAVRISDVLINQNLFLNAELTKIGTAYLAMVIFLVRILPRSHFAMWIAVFLPLTCLAIVLYALVNRRSSRFRFAVAEALGLILLKMNGGRSFRQAMTEVIGESDPQIRAKLSEIGARVVFSQQKSDITSDAFIAEVIEELTLIDRQPHAATRRLAIFREKLRIENDFRRRSGQVLARIRAQSLVMTGLYVLLAAFIAWKFGWYSNLRVFAFSAALFSIGSLWIWYGGKNLKWKV